MLIEGVSQEKNQVIRDLERVYGLNTNGSLYTVKKGNKLLRGRIILRDSELNLYGDINKTYPDILIAKGLTGLHSLAGNTYLFSSESNNLTQITNNHVYYRRDKSLSSLADWFYFVDYINQIEGRQWR